MSSDRWNSSLYDQRHSFVWKYGEGVIELLKPQAGERILDVGCGTGHLTKKIADAGAMVTGMDSSENMITAARADYPGLEFVQADVTDFSFEEKYDAVFSSATLHWVTKAEQAIICMARALKSGGRFVVEFGGKGNIQNILQALENSMQQLGFGGFIDWWYYPSIGEYTPLLEKHGLLVEQAWLFNRPTLLEGEDGMLNWLRMFGTVKTQHLSEADRERAFTLTVAKLRDVQYIDGYWYADYRRIRVVARKV
jgi:trans-aconitate 2-methyltransferase